MDQMNSLIMKHKPKESSRDEFRETWEAGSYVMTPLYNLLTELAQEKETIKEDDFDCPNHYQRMIYREAKRQAYLEIRDLLPGGCKE